MAVMISDDKKELIVTCKCGCQDTIHIKVDDKDKDSDYYAIQTYMSGNWYRDQDDTVLRCIGRKLKKIWSIIRNKDYYYSDVLMSKEDFQKYKEYVNQFQENKKMYGQSILNSDFDGFVVMERRQINKLRDK